MVPPRERLEGELARGLEALAAAGLARTRTLPRGIDFSSNDYLGLAGDPDLAAAIAGRLARALADGEPFLAPASRLLRGETEVHRRLEARLAALKGAEAALVFASGWQANAALLTTLVAPTDRVLSDALNHASLIDGLRAAGCTRVVFPHLDVDAVARALATPHAGGRTFLVTESLFSMDGDLAPLSGYAELCERHDAGLIVDEAHAAGVYGPARGSGWVEELGLERRVTATVTTLGKALGLQGAVVAGPAVVVETLVQRARPFLFTTAVAPLVLLALEAVLDFLDEQPERRGRALAGAAFLRRRLAEEGVAALPGGSPIVPVVVGGNEAAMAIAARLQEEGLDVRAVRPPTVPRGTARLRISVHADHDVAVLDRLALALARALAPWTPPEPAAVPEPAAPPESTAPPESKAAPDSKAPLAPVAGAAPR